MRVEKIIFQETFPTMQFANQRLGVEIQLDEGESPEDIFKKAQTIVRDAFKSMNPQLYNGSEYVNFPETKTPSIIQTDPQVNRIEAIINDMNSCKEIKVLESYKFIVKSNPQLQEAYDNKIKQLNNGSG